MNDQPSIEEMKSAAMFIMNIAKQAMMVPLATAQAAANQARREESMAALLDPTHWMQNGDAMEDNVQLLRAFAEFRAKLAEIAGDQSEP